MAWKYTEGVIGFCRLDERAARNWAQPLRPGIEGAARAADLCGPEEGGSEHGGQDREDDGRRDGEGRWQR